MGKSIKFTQGQFFVALRRLESWFDRQRRILPWRDSPTLYRVWISEVMLQQTQVATVIPYFERFTARFPTVEALAAASEDEVLAHWAGLGYYSRARNLYQAAKRITEEGFPRDREGWLDLPGIGAYTAGAILSIALDQPEPILDGNVERVLSRLRRASDKERLWRYADAFVKTGFKQDIRPSILNQALMELGATLCTPRKPQCAGCPLLDICKACSHGDAEAFPAKRARKNWVQMNEEMHCLISDDGRVLVRKRGPGEWRAGLWDLIERKEMVDLLSGESTRKDWKPIGKIETRHIVTRHKISRVTHVWRARKPSQRSDSKGGPELQWIPVNSPEGAYGSALRRTLKKLQETFPEVLQ